MGGIMDHLRRATRKHRTIHNSYLMLSFLRYVPGHRGAQQLTIRSPYNLALSTFPVCPQSPTALAGIR